MTKNSSNCVLGVSRSGHSPPRCGMHISLLTSFLLFQSCKCLIVSQHIFYSILGFNKKSWCIPSDYGSNPVFNRIIELIPHLNPFLDFLLVFIMYSCNQNILNCEWYVFKVAPVPGGVQWWARRIFWNHLFLLDEHSLINSNVIIFSFC